MTINKIELAALFAQVQPFYPAMDPLSHIRTAVDNMAAQGWPNWWRVSTEKSGGPILRDLALLPRSHKSHYSVQCITVSDKKMANAASWLTHLNGNIFSPTSLSPFHRESPGGCSPFCQGASGG